MRKAEFRTQAEIFEAPTYYSKKENVRQFRIYQACQFKDESPDPSMQDIKFFLNEHDAIDYADELSIEIGFNSQVESLIFTYEDFNQVFDFRDEFELEELTHKKVGADYEKNIYSGFTNEGENLEGAIIVEWSWEKYTGYARNLHGVRIAGEGETTNSIDTGNMHSTFRPNESVLLTAKEAEGLEGEELEDAIREELNKGHWQWNYFKNNPRTLIIDL